MLQIQDFKMDSEVLAIENDAHSTQNGERMHCVKVIQVSVAMHTFQPACDGKYLAIPYAQRGMLGLWNLQNLTDEPVLLRGHAWSVTALSLSNGEMPKLLCSCAEDWIILWNLELITATTMHGGIPRSQAKFPSPGDVHFSCFLPDDQTLALVVDRDIYLYKSDVNIATLEGHVARVTAVTGSTQQPDILISVSEDRTFMVWDVQQLAVLHQSSIITGSPIINVACDDFQPRFVMGSVDGQLWMHDLSPGSQYRELAHVDVGKHANSLVPKVQPSSPVDSGGPIAVTGVVKKARTQLSEKLNGVDGQLKLDGSNQSEPGWAILGLLFQKPPKKWPSDEYKPTPSISLLGQCANFKEILSPAPTLLIGMTTAVMSLNLRTFEVQMIANFQNVEYISEKGKTNTIGLAGTVGFSEHEQNSNKVWCVVGSLFNSTIYLGLVNAASDTTIATSSTSSSLSIELEAKNVEQESGDDTTDDELLTEKLSLLASGPLATASPLRASYQSSAEKLKTASRRTSREKVSTRSMARIRSRDSSVGATFQRVRSSGYANAPWSISKLSRSSSSCTVSESLASLTHSTRNSLPKVDDSSTTLIHKLCQDYPLNSPLPVNAVKTIPLLDKNTSITALKFSGDGVTLACATTCDSAHIIKTKGKIVHLLGHNSVVNSVYFNLDGSHLLTSSDDRSVKLWHWKHQEPLMNFQTIHCTGNMLRDLSPDATANAHQTFTSEIVHAQFYYMDKFILLTAGSSIYLYKYNIEANKSDVNRFRYRGRYKLVKQFTMPAQKVLSTAAINQFHSYLVLCTCSDRSVNVIDMNVGKLARQLHDVHTKPAYKICLNEGSPFVSQHPSAYNMFLTASVGDNIKLWDLRTSRCVQRYNGNVNRALHCGLAFSPCARYFACGSEDKAAYIFDLRHGMYTHKLSGHSDVVTEVQYKPDEPLLVTGTNDGMLTFFVP